MSKLSEEFKRRWKVGVYAQRRKGGDQVIGRGRPTLETTCDGCDESTKCYRFADKWLCEYCLNLAEETL